MAVLHFAKELGTEIRGIICNWITREYGCQIYAGYDKGRDYAVEFTNCKGLPNGERQILVECKTVTKDCYTVKVFSV